MPKLMSPFKRKRLTKHQTLRKSFVSNKFWEVFSEGYVPAKLLVSLHIQTVIPT